jgi:hypothetical protein
MTIKASRSGGAAEQGAGAYPLPRKTAGPGPTAGHRASPVENQGLLNRMDEQKDSFSESEYSKMLRDALDTPSDERRIDSYNFPSDKDW